MAIDKQGALWIGTWGGLSKIDGSTWKTFKREDGLAHNAIYSVAVDTKGIVWVGTYSGLSRFDGSSWKTYTLYGLMDIDVHAITFDNQGSVWVGTHGGVTRFDGSSWKNYMYTEGIFSGWVQAIAVDRNGVIWFGTNEGVSRFDGFSWKRYTTSDGLLDNLVNTIAFDDHNAIWLGTSEGVSKLEEQIPASVSEPNSPQSLSIQGVYPNPFNPSTTITFSLPRASRAEISVYSITGQKIRTLASGQFAPGTHSIQWDGRNESWLPVASGIYLAVVQAGSTRAVHRMLLMR
jgi:ligand-binding sensor domain-containing protein